MDGFPLNVTPIAWRQVRHNEHFWNGIKAERWRYKESSDANYLIVDVKPRRVLVVPEHDLPETFDSLIVGYFDSNCQWIALPYTVEERR